MHGAVSVHCSQHGLGRDTKPLPGRGGLSPLSRGAWWAMWERTVGSLLCTSAHQYLKSNRLMGSGTDFNGSFHALGKSFPTDFSFPKQVCVRLLKWG